MNRAPNQARFLLWIDAVGGFQVCLADAVRVGQAVPGSEVEVPILADLARNHATLRRDREGYVIEPTWESRLGGRRLERASALADGAEIELGPALRMRFRQPHALSATARLELVSRHQTKPSTNGVVLMAEACILGPGSRCHVVCRSWPAEVVLLRSSDGIVCCAPGEFEIDGRRTVRQGLLSLNSTVSGDRFSFSLEEL